MAYRAILAAVILLGLCLLALVGCGAKKPPTIVKVIETQRIEVPVPVERRPPAELLAHAQPALPVFVAPSDPAASSALTDEGERLLRALIEELLARIAAWQAWATETP
jgi:hypothetical protein